MTKRIFGLLLAAAVLLSPAFADTEMVEASAETNGEAGITEPVAETGESVAIEQPTEIETPAATPLEIDGEPEVTEPVIEAENPAVTEQPAATEIPAETPVEPDGEPEITELVIETEVPAVTEQPAATEIPAETPVEPDGEAEITGPAIETEEPAATEQPTETEVPVETEQPMETEEPTETETPAETEQPTETETPQETTVPTSTPTTTPDIESDVIISEVRLTIDNRNVYEGMERAYKDGYVPTVEDGVLTVILPLIADGAVKGDIITVTPQLGDAASSPVQIKNYQKSFELAANKVNETKDGKYDLSSSYLVRFDFPLVADRKNGTYSLALETVAKGVDGAEYTQVFTCYYTITDGQSADSGNDIAVDFGGGGVEEETPESKPKIIVSRYTLDLSPVPAGETFSATVTLENTSETQNVQNMLVTISCDSKNFVLQDPSNSIYVGDISAGESKDIVFSYATDLETPPQRYTFTIAMEYDDSDAVTMTSQGTVLVEVLQTPRIELSPFRLDESVTAGETIQMAFQVMNLGRSDLYNVRVEIEVPGLKPMGTAFIGDLTAGTSASETMNVFVGMISTEANADRYGPTSGVVRLIYEDSTGTEYTEETEVSTTINELVIAAPDTSVEEQEQTRASMWWIAILVGAVVAGGIAVIVLHRKRKL